jgi:hypothetical protein
MFRLRRISIGLVLRLIIATLISLLVWWLSTTPFDRLPLPRPAILVIVRILDFPVALAGELLYPIRGMELVFRDYDTWCDFCSIGEMFWQQMRIAIPTYLILLDIPILLRAVARRDTRLFKRIVIGLLIYTMFTAAFLVMGNGDRRGDVRIAVLCLLILSAAAGVAWSNLTERLKGAGISFVLLIGAWSFVFMRTFIAPKMDEVRPYFVSYLLLLIAGVGGTLLLTWAIESGIDWWRRGRSNRAESHS